MYFYMEKLMLNFQDEAVGAFLQKLEEHGVKNFKMMLQHDNQWYAVYLTPRYRFFRVKNIERLIDLLQDLTPFVNNREIKLNKKVLALLEEVETEF